MFTTMIIPCCTRFITRQTISNMINLLVIESFRNITKLFWMPSGSGDIVKFVSHAAGAFSVCSHSFIPNKDSLFFSPQKLWLAVYSPNIDKVLYKEVFPVLLHSAWLLQQIDQAKAKVHWTHALSLPIEKNRKKIARLETRIYKITY